LSKEKEKAPLRIATFLLEFLIRRDKVAVIKGVQTGKTSKVKGDPVTKNPNYVQLLFSIEFLPISMSLPMVCPGISG